MGDYYRPDFDRDSESSRLLKRAEFLKAVRAKERVEWPPNANARIENGILRYNSSTYEVFDELRVPPKPKKKIGVVDEMLHDASEQVAKHGYYTKNEIDPFFESVRRLFSKLEDRIEKLEKKRK